MPKTTGDDLFERYLREHRYDPGPHEPDLSEHGIETRPDYVVTRDGVRVACEVEQFKAGGSKLEKRMASQRFGWASDKEVYGRIRNRVGHAAQQLKPLTALELPMLVVLANPEGTFVDLSVEHVLASLYGNPTYTMQIDTSTGGAVGEGRFEFGRDGKLTNDHPNLSGIALLRRREHKTDAVDEIAAQQQDEVCGDVAPLVAGAAVTDEAVVVAAGAFAKPVPHHDLEFLGREGLQAFDGRELSPGQQIGAASAGQLRERAEWDCFFFRVRGHGRNEGLGP